MLQHGVSSPRGGCKHGTRALFQGSPLKGQRLRRDLDSAAAFITSGAGAAWRARRRTRRGSCRASGGVASLLVACLRGASATAWQDLHPAHRSRPPSAGAQGPPRPLGAPTLRSVGGPLGSTSTHSEGPGLASSRFSYQRSGDSTIWFVKWVFSPLVAGATLRDVVSKQWLFALSRQLCRSTQLYSGLDCDRRHPPQSRDQVTRICGA